MNLLHRLLPAAPRGAVQPVAHWAPTQAPAQDTPVAQPPAAADSCGWYDSSRELQQGLAVREWSDDEAVVAALFFARLQPSSAQLQ